MKKIIFLVSFIFFLSAAYAGGIGDSCNYYSNGDLECNTAENIYCLEFECDFVSDPNNLCIDSDSNNLASSGETYSRHREYNGTWMNLSNEDECLNDNAFVSSCTGSLCKIREATCIGKERVFETHSCENCDNGACLSYSPPTVIGNSCNYSLNGDLECDAENRIYCISNTCTLTEKNMTEYCTDTDDANYFNRGRVDFMHRDHDTGERIESLGYDSCNNEDYLTEFVCGEGTIPGLNYCPTEVYCENGCYGGKCNPITDESIIGNSCDYFANQDNECDPENNIYCMENECTFFDGNTENYCFDLGQDYFTKEYVDVRYRELINGTLVSDRVYDSCDGDYLNDFFCLENIVPNYGPELVECENSCSNGKCISLDANIEGNSCDYNSFMDSECDAENGIYCINNKCTFSDENVDSYCIDLDKTQNVLFRGSIEYSFRAFNGSINSGIGFDYCSNENTLIQFKCNNAEIGINTIPEETDCLCNGGICAQDLIEVPETVSDSELLEFISKWSKSLISDQKIMQIIEVWKNS